MRACTHEVEDTGLTVHRRGSGWRQEGVVGYCVVCRRFLVRGLAIEDAPQAFTREQVTRLNRAAERQRRHQCRAWLKARYPRHAA